MGERDACLPPLAGDQHPNGGVRGQPLSVVGVLVPCQAAIDGLAEQVRQRELTVASGARIGEVSLDQGAQAEPPVQLAGQQQPAPTISARPKGGQGKPRQTGPCGGRTARDDENWQDGATLSRASRPADPPSPRTFLPCRICAACRSEGAVTIGKESAHGDPLNSVGEPSPSRLPTRDSVTQGRGRQLEAGNEARE